MTKWSYALPKRSILSVVLLFCCLSLLIPPADAKMCYRGRPAPECDSFWIAEYGLGTQLKKGPLSEVGWTTSEIGVMFNVSPRYAVGATTYIPYNFERENLRLGAKFRFRRWLDRDWSLNLSSGLIFAGTRSRGEVYTAFAGHIDVSYVGVGVTVTAAVGLADPPLLPICDKPRPGVIWYG